MFRITAKLKIAAGLAAGALTLGGAGAYAAANANNTITVDNPTSFTLGTGDNQLTLVPLNGAAALTLPANGFKNTGECVSWLAKNRNYAVAPQGSPSGSHFLFRHNRAEQRRCVVLLPDERRQIVAIGLESNRLVVDIGVDIVKAPVPELALIETGLQPPVVLPGRKQRSSGVVDRLENPELRFQLLDDDERRPLELQRCDPSAQIVDLEHVLVHGLSLATRKRVSESANGRRSWGRSGWR